MLQRQPLVSVIVPLYNVEHYIERCTQSIINQEYRNLEIILVDDGSPDASGMIVDNLATQDTRIRVIHKENGGVSSTRNTGLAAAHGEYIAFIDGDDYVERDYVSYLVGLADKNHCDIAISQNHFTSENNSQIDIDRQLLVSAEQIIESIYLGAIDVAVWNKLYRRSFLNKHAQQFNKDIWYGEGMLFNIECLQYTDWVALGQRKIYHQVFNPQSAMRKFSLESNYCGLRSLDIQKQKWKKRNSRIKLAWDYHHRCFSNSILCGLVKTNTVEENKEEYRKCIRNLRSNIHIPLMVDIPLKQKLYYLVAWICPVLLAKRNAWKERRHLEKLRKEREKEIRAKR